MLLQCGRHGDISFFEARPYHQQAQLGEHDAPVFLLKVVEFCHDNLGSGLIAATRR